VRLSVLDSGKKDGESILNQQELLERYVAKRPEFTIKGIYTDNGETGVNFFRPAWNDLIRDCQDGKINCIVVKDLSRVGRNYIETGDYLERILPMLGIRLIAVNDGYDNINLTSGDRLVSGLKNLVNDIYAKDISRKVSAALHIKQKQGAFIGAFAPYGFMKDRDDKNKIVADPETSPVVRQIFEWKAEGLGMNMICRRLETQGIPSPGRYRFMKGIMTSPKFENKLWNPNTVKLIIESPVYIGHMAQGKFFQSVCDGKAVRRTRRDEWVVVENTHDAIISQELYDKANSVIVERKARYDENCGRYACFDRTEYILQGLVFCADCGKKMMRQRSIYKNKKTAVWYYECRRKRIQNMCSKKSIREHDLIGAVYEAVRVELQTCVDIKAIIEKMNRESSHKSRLARFDAEIEEAEKEMRRISSLRQGVYEDYAAKLLTVSEYQYATDKYNADSEKQRVRLEAAHMEKSEYAQKATPVNKWLAVFSQFIDAQELTAEMAQAIIERVDISDYKRITVTFKFRDEFNAVKEYAEAL
jgi:DNA invertase Pin-like site-specific DNA recombinase